MDAVELHAPEVEEALLAAMLQHRTASIAVQELGLTRKDYGSERNATLHDAMMRIVERGGSVDTAMVIAELEATGMLEVIGGKAPVERLGVIPSDTGMVGSYVGTLKDRAMRRGIQRSVERAMHHLYSEPDQRAMFALVQKEIYREFDRHLSTTHTGVKTTDLRARFEGRENMEFMPYATARLTHCTGGGIPRGGLTIWGGHTSHGKTTQMIHEFIETCRRGDSAAFFALEMTEDQMVERILAQVSGVHPREIRKQEQLSNAQKNAIDDAWTELSSWDAELFADPEISPEDIRAMQLRRRWRRVLVDYLQRHDFTDYKELARFSKFYKNLALMTECAIDLGSQVNPGEIRPGQMPFPIPNNNQLFGGKVIGHEADNIIFVWARQIPVGEGQWSLNGEGLFVVTKVRSGEAHHRIDTRWDREHLRWKEMDGEGDA